MKFSVPLEGKVWRLSLKVTFVNDENVVDGFEYVLQYTYNTLKLLQITKYYCTYQTTTHVKCNWPGINVKAPITGKLEHLSCFSVR